MTLQHFIIIFGAVQLCLSQLPTIHSLRGLSTVCTFCTVGFSITTVVMSIKNGARPHYPSSSCFMLVSCRSGTVWNED